MKQKRVGKKRGLNLEYCEYDLSKINDSMGGFFLPETETEKGIGTGAGAGIGTAVGTVAERTFRETGLGNGSIIGTLGTREIALPDDLECIHCKSFEVDSNFYRYYNVLVCRSCKNERPEEYSLLTKTEARQDYLLTDSELRDKEKMPHWIKPNPHKSTYSNMLLYLRKQVEAFAWEKWGSPEELDKEFERREAQTVVKKEKIQKKKMTELRKKTRTSLWNATQLDLKTGGTKFNNDHEHNWSPAISLDEFKKKQTCTICNISQEYEEL